MSSAAFHPASAGHPDSVGEARRFAFGRFGMSKDPVFKMHTPEDALAMLFMLALPKGTPKPGTAAYEKWAKTRQGRFLCGLYSDIQNGFKPKE
jgi:hypothetical protein